MTREIDYSLLNPGIRMLVQFLNEQGFETTDSGDGKTNVESGMECAMDVPNVHMIVRPADRIVHESRRLYDVMKDHGIALGPLGEDGIGPTIEASYSPVDNISITR